MKDSEFFFPTLELDWSSWSCSVNDWRGNEISSLSVCKAASFPGQRTEQAAINYKEILSSCGRFCNNVSIQSKQIWCVWELGALYSCHTKSRPADPLTADQRGVTTGGVGGLLSARRSIIIPTSVSLLVSKNDGGAVWKVAPVYSSLVADLRWNWSHEHVINSTIADIVWEALRFETCSDNTLPIRLGIGNREKQLSLLFKSSILPSEGMRLPKKTGQDVSLYSLAMQPSYRNVHNQPLFLWLDLKTVSGSHNTGCQDDGWAESALLWWKDLFVGGWGERELTHKLVWVTA